MDAEDRDHTASSSTTVSDDEDKTSSSETEELDDSNPRSSSKRRPQWGDNDVEEDEVDGEEDTPRSPLGIVIPELGRSQSIFGDDMDDPSRPSLPITIEFENLCFSVQVSKGFMAQAKKLQNPFAKEPKYLLKNLNATFYPNQVTAIMGPSGAGKTTLLNLLAGRISGGKIKGQVRINGIKTKHISQTKWQRICAYVMQDDIMQGHLTARETFTFISWLRLRSALIHPQKSKRHVEAVLKELGLLGCASTRIGSPDARGISGGQRKRVSIGMEMITEPSVLFLDEPTSGLDSSTAFHLATTLKKLAMVGRTIVTTIHQPSTDIFATFDRVLFLSAGHIVYNGPPQDLVPYFSKLNFKCPKYTNPAEFAMNLAKSDSHISSKDEGKERVNQLVIAYREAHDLGQWDFDESDAANVKALARSAASTPRYREDEDDGARWGPTERVRQWIRKRRGTGQAGGDTPVVDKAMVDAEEHAQGQEFAKKLKPQHRANFFLQLLVLTARESLSSIRNPLMTWARLIQTVFLALMVGVVFLQIGDDQASIQDRLGALFFVVVNQAFGSIMASVTVFPVDRVIYIREHASGAYGTLAYYLAKTVADLPYAIAFPALMGIITYWMVGFDAVASKFFIYVAALVVMSNVGQAFGMFVSAGVSSIQVSMALVPVIFIPLMLFGGFFLNNDNIPVWLTWVQWLSLFKYGFEIVVINEFEGLTFTCDGDDPCPIARTGEQELHNLSMDNAENKIWIDFVCLIALYLLFKFLGYWMLRFTAGRKRGA